MSSEKRSKGLFRKMWDGIVNMIFGEDTVNEATLETDARDMVKALETNRQAVAQTMGLAIQTKELLKRAISRYEELERAAKQFLAQGKEAEANRLASQLLELNQQIAELTDRYESQQAAGNNAIVTFQANRQTVEERLKKLQRLKELQEVNRLREQVQDSLQSFDLNAPRARFDQVAGKIEGKAAMLDAGDKLADVEGTRLDLSIQKQLANQKVEALMAGMKAELALQGTSGETLRIESPSTKARLLLSGPEFSALSLTDLQSVKKSPVKVEVVSSAPSAKPAEPVIEAEFEDGK